MKLKTSLAVLYECLEQDILPIKDAILKEYEVIMNSPVIDPENVLLSDLLDMAWCCAYEVEHVKRCNKEDKDSASGT